MLPFEAFTHFSLHSHSMDVPACGHSHRYVLPRLALVGDAAHVVHPLAGQGVNLGLGDVRQLVSALAEAIEVGQDIGNVNMLKVCFLGRLSGWH